MILEELEADFELEKAEGEDVGENEDAEQMRDEEDETPEALVQRLKEDKVMHIKNLLVSPQLAGLLKMLSTAQQLDSSGDKGHKLIVECNEMIVEINNELAALHRELRAKYTKKFPELEKLVPNALDYARCVKAIKNEMDLTTIDLGGILPSSILMVVTISGSTSDGVKLLPEDLKRCEELCDEMIGLESSKNQIVEYIRTRMDDLCPNVAAVVGSHIAAQLVGAAGGIVQLSKLPSSVVQVLGQRKDVLQGLSTASIAAHQGFVYASEIVSDMPPVLRTRAARFIAGKVTLAARVDSFKQNPDGSVGREFRAEILKRLEKLQEPPPAKKLKALPAPDDTPRKRRGGRRARAMKTRYEMTELQKQANRTKFGLPEATDEFDPTKEDLGMLTGSTGRIRLTAQESKLASKLLQKKKQSNKGHSSGATSGLASSLAFTPVQGLELNNPLAQTPKPDDKYFGTSTTFFRAPAAKRQKKN